jgi:hypothetical protein
MPAPVPGPHDGPAVVVSTASRTLRRQLRPLVWVALEEVALAAAAEGGRLVARTSARQVAEQLGLDAGTAAAALRVLRQRGLLVLEREKGPTGRFGLSVYVLGSVAGLTVLSPRAADPHMDEQGGGRPPVGSQPWRTRCWRHLMSRSRAWLGRTGRPRSWPRHTRVNR